MTNNALRISIALAFAVGASACGDDSAGAGGTDTDASTAGPTSSPEDDDGPGTDGESSGGDETATEGTGGDTDEPPLVDCEETVFDNAVDQALCPYVQAEGIQPEPADQVEVCRRLYIDLLGISPTSVDYEVDCKNRSVEEIVDDFMARPEYVVMSQRMWADVFHMNSELTYYQYIAELDAMVGQLYAPNPADQITLDTFAVEAVTHPAFLGRWDGLDLVGFNFLSHFKRDASGAERLDIFPLFRMWEERDFTDPVQGATQRVVLNTNNCVNSALCSSDYWQAGDQVAVAQPSPGAADPELNVIDVDLLTPAQWDVLRLPGQRIAASGEFYEAYIDRTIDRYLGYDLGTMVPAARQALVDLLEANNGNARVVDRELLTALVYTATNTYEEDDKPDPSDWDAAFWHGPTKQMDAEVWLRSTQRLVGQVPGSCDHRYPEVLGTHPHNYPTTDGTTPDYAFRDTARLLGGCPDRESSFRETRAGLIAALTQATLTRDLCLSATDDSPIYPDQFIEDPNDEDEASLSKAANQISAAALIKPIPETASDALVAGVDGCRDDSTCNPAQFAEHTCRLVIKSSDFLFY
jgi:hypothetical protein